MRRFQSNNIETSPKASQKRLFLVSSGALILSIALMTVVVVENQVEEYIFHPKEDNFYENPENWSPSYPGTHIEKNEKVVLEGISYVTNFNLTVDGQLVLNPSATLYSFAGNLTIEPKGSLENNGELMINQLLNKGLINNRISAKIDVLDYETSPGAETNNFPSASFTSARGLVNKGIFNNYSHCAVKTEFRNEASFNQLRGGLIIFRGKEASLDSEFAPVPQFSQRAN